MSVSIDPLPLGGAAPRQILVTGTGVVIEWPSTCLLLYSSSSSSSRSSSSRSSSIFY